MSSRHDRRSAAARPSAPIWWLGVLVPFLGCRAPTFDVPALAGTWIVPEPARAVFSRVRPRIAYPRHSAMTLRLEPDGTFRASELPGELLTFMPPGRDGLASGTGTWKPVTRNGQPEVQLVFLTLDLTGTRRVPYGTFLGISGKPGSVTLFFFHSDADEGARVVFERKQ